ncbi:MAG TPA: AI-2E family transporter YdiK [Burkholderiales bacterium]|jgi:predicted PurR-regulated permease PerM|nr:AI-2E family transporter YdiK [Burkholderiales bacterium]HSB49081.1 AI-2E family transporter YdiK [Burkholderiales bacterium]
MNKTQRGDGDLARVVLGVLTIGGLMAATLWILYPFLGAIIWAIMIVVATWPMMLGLQRRVGRRWIAVTIMSIALLLVLIVPLAAAVGTVITHVDDIVAWAKGLRDLQVPPPPSWLAGVPLVGERFVTFWKEVAAEGMQVLAARITPYAGAITSWFVGQVGSVGALFLQFLLTVIAAAVLYSNGEDAADWALRFGARTGGERGEAAVRLSGQAIRSVARGVVLTALLQALVGGIGVWLAGVPFATLLTALMFLLAVAQIGAGPVLAGATIWLYWSGSPGWGTFLLVITIIAATLDNVVRPILIKQGAADLPLLLIFVGVIGGLITFGLIGIFIGPLVLAVTHTLLRAWLHDDAMQRTA